MTLKLYGTKLSFPCNKVQFLANFLKMDYEYQEMNMMAGDHQKDDYLKIHPFGKVPAISDGDFNLFESNTILRYLANKANSDLYPSDNKERILVDQWLDFVASHIHQAMVRVAFNEIFAKRLPNFEYDEKSSDFGKSLFERFLPVLEKQLKENNYLANSKLSIADFALFACLEPVEAVAMDMENYPSIQKMRMEFRSQDWYTKVYPSFEKALEQVFSQKAS